MFADKIAKRINSLALDPFPSDYRKLGGEQSYRIRVGQYRIVYTVHSEDNVVIIERVKHRKDVYR